MPLAAAAIALMSGAQLMSPAPRRQARPTPKTPDKRTAPEANIDFDLVAPPKGKRARRRNKR